MLENRKGLVSTSSLGGKKQQINFAMSFFAIFQRKRQFEKHAICLVKLLFTCQPRNRVFIFFFYFFLVTLPGLIDTLAQLLALRSML